MVARRRNPVPNEYSNIIQGSFGSAQQDAVSSIEDDPDKAARAMELGEASGQSPSVVYGDLENFDANYRRQLTGDLIRNSPHLSAYINSDPMAAKVSNGDWANLHSVSQAMEKLGPRFPGRATATKATDEFVEGFKYGFGSIEDLGSWAISSEESKKWIADHPTLAKAIVPNLQRLGLAIEVPAKSFSGLLEGLKSGGVSIATQLGMSQPGAERLMRDVTGMTEYELVKPEIGLHPHVEPFFKAGEIPPPRV